MSKRKKDINKLREKLGPPSVDTCCSVPLLLLIYLGCVLVCSEAEYGDSITFLPCKSLLKFNRIVSPSMYT